MSERISDIVKSDYRVIYGDTDQMGVVYYANYLRLFERGRCEFMRAGQLNYSEVEKAGYILPVVDAHVQYKSSAHFDDLLSIETWIEKRSRIKIFFAYKIMRGEEIIAVGTTIHACLHKGRPARLPPALDQLCREPEPKGAP